MSVVSNFLFRSISVPTLVLFCLDMGIRLERFWEVALRFLLTHFQGIVMCIILEARWVNIYPSELLNWFIASKFWEGKLISFTTHTAALTRYYRTIQVAGIITSYALNLPSGILFTYRLGYFGCVVCARIDNLSWNTSYDYQRNIIFSYACCYCGFVFCH